MENVAKEERPKGETAKYWADNAEAILVEA